MYKIVTVWSLASLVSLSLLGMQPAYFGKFYELPQDIRHLIIMHALDKNSIAQSLRNLRLVNREFYAFLNKDSIARQHIVKELADNFDVSPRTIALHIIKVCNLKPDDPVAQRLLEDNPVNKKLNGAFLNAVDDEDRARAQSLLRQGADVNAQTKDGETALMIAISKANADLAGLFLNIGVVDNAPDALDRVKGMVELLLNAGADVNAREKDGKTALMWAAFNGHKNIVELLLKANAHVNVKDDKNNTALTIALLYERPEIVDLLRQYLT